MKDLISWLHVPIIGTKKNCNRDDHCSPFSFVRDVLTGKVSNYIVWANRAGSKSFLAGMITWIQSSFLPKLETTILGGSLEQSQKSYKAMNDFWELTDLVDLYLSTEPSMKKTEWKNGSIASVLTASTRSTRGPHSQHLIIDECDEMDEEVYTAALSIPQSKYGIRASTGKLSTNHKIGGVMDKALEKGLESGTAIFKWCIWETLQSCRDYSCSTCKLSSYCPGKHMKKANGYYLIDDFVQKLYELSDMTLQVEWFCEKVGRDDLIYGAQYDEEINSPNDLPVFDPTKKVNISIDWGGTNPFSCGAWQEFKGLGWVRVDEVYMGNTTNARFMKECKARPWWKKISEGVADPARSDLIREWREEGVDIYKAKGDVDEGIEAMRDSLSPVLGKPKIYINRRCRAWRTEVGQYSEKNGKPIKENDHALDESRYFVTKYVKPLKQVRVRRVS